MSSSNHCFLTCIPVSQEAGQVVWYSHLFQNFSQFIVIHTVEGYWRLNTCISLFEGLHIHLKATFWLLHHKMTLISQVDTFIHDEHWKYLLGGPSSRIWRRQWHPTPILLLGKSHGRRSLVGYSPWGLEESDMTERLHFHFSLSCTGEGNGNPLQYSCLENPRDGGAWWAAVYGAAQSCTRLSSSSSSRI